MLFNSFLFLAFALIALGGHAFLRGRAMRVWLLVASYFFYGWGNPWYCLLLLLSTVVDFTAGLQIHATSDAKRRKMWLLLSIFTNLGLLAAFKYAKLFERLFNWWLLTLFDAQLPFTFPEATLPIGLSFYTFQTLSYTIDVYRGKITPTRSFTTMALYVSFFPQLVAGPIERAKHLLPQLEEKQTRTREDIMAGMTRIMWGLVKKLVFADTFGIWVTMIWGNPMSATPWELFLAMHVFSFQLYLDFSGYTDIAIGLARMMGIRLQENFRYPFLSRNPLEFFMRWHISLSTWIRDYLYIPLGGNRVGWFRRELNTLFVMLVIGLWHGANEKFILWGLVHWIYDIVYRGGRVMLGLSAVPKRDSKYRWRDLPAAFLTYLLFVPHVFFGAPSVDHARAIFSGMLCWWGTPHFSQPTSDVLRVTIFLLIAISMHVIRGLGVDKPLHKYKSPVAYGVFWAFLLIVIALFHAPSHQQFYYFRF